MCKALFNPLVAALLLCQFPSWATPLDPGLATSGGPAVATCATQRRDFRFVMTNAMFSRNKVEDVADCKRLGVDELLNFFLVEKPYPLISSRGIPGLVDQLAEAQRLGGVKVYVGLMTGQSPYSQDLYLSDYLGDIVTLSPRAIPVGNFIANETGSDAASFDIRTARKGIHAPGYLLKGSQFPTIYWWPSRDSRGATMPVYFRAQLPVKVEGNWRGLPADTVLGTFTVDQNNEAGTGVPAILGMATIKAGDFASETSWLQKSVVVSGAGLPGNPLKRLRMSLHWTGAADLSVGTIDFQRWDPTGQRPWKEALRDGIYISEPNQKYGRNIQTYLDDVHSQIQARDPRLFDAIAGFFVYDEPSATFAQSWTIIARGIEAYLDTKVGFNGKRLVLNFFGTGTAVSDPANAYFQVFRIDRFLSYHLPFLSFDDYLTAYFFNPNRPCPSCLDADFQTDTDRVLADWGTMAAAARSRGIPPFMNIAITGPNLDATGITKEMIAVQIYLALSYGYDRVGFWNIDQVRSMFTNLPGPAALWLEEIIGRIKPMIPLYNQLSFVTHYNSQNMTDRFISRITPVNVPLQPNFRVDVGEFSRNGQSYLMFVNRHFLPQDTFDLRVTVKFSGAETYCLEEWSGASLGCVSAGNPDFPLRLGPGEGRLVLVKNRVVGPVAPDCTLTGIMPPRPTGLVASSNTGTIALRWNDNSSYELGYLIERADHTGVFDEIKQLPANATTFTDTGLMPSATFKYRVRAYQSGRVTSGYSNEATVSTPPLPPAAPTGLAAANGPTFDTAALQWLDNSSDEFGFKVERSRDGTTFTTVSSVPANIRSWTDVGLLGGTAYYYRVRAFGTGGDSDPSNVALIVTSPTPALPGGGVTQDGTRAGDTIFATSAGSDGVYVAGVIGDASGITTEGFLRKYSFSLSELWTIRFGPGSSAFGVSALGDDVIVGGYRRAAGRIEGFVHKYNAAGQLGWQEALRTPTGEVQVWSVALAPDCVFAVGFTTGVFTGQAKLAGDPENAFVAKLGSSGWVRQYDTGRALGVSADGSGLYVVGDASRTGNQRAAYVRKWNNSGYAGWKDEWASGAGGGAKAVVRILPSGGREGAVYAVGNDVTGGFLRRYNGDGIRRWVQVVTGVSELRGVAADLDGAYVAGYSNAPGPAVLKRFVDQTEVRNITLGDASSFNRLWSVTLVNGTAYAGGATTGTLTSAPNRGNFDLFLRKEVMR